MELWALTLPYPSNLMNSPIILSPITIKLVDIQVVCA